MSDPKFALHEAAAKGNINGIKKALEDGCDINARNEDSLTPLLLACGERKLSAVRALLEAKADPNICSTAGFTPLISAAANSDFGTIQALIEAKADTNATEKDGFAAIHIATSKGHEGSITALLEAKADCNTAASGCYPLHIALDIEDAKQRLKIVKILLDAGATLNAPDPDGQTPLMHALRAEAEMPNLVITQLLIERKADVNEVSEDLRPLHVAVRIGAESAIKALIKANADVNATLPAQGFTPLHVAALSDGLAAAKLLVDAKAVLDIKDVAGMPAVFHAAMSGHDALTTFLADSGADLTMLQDEATMELMKMELQALAMGQEEDEDSDDILAHQITPAMLGEGDDEEEEEAKDTNQKQNQAQQDSNDAKNADESKESKE